jgi:hypothetical protein
MERPVLVLAFEKGIQKLLMRCHVKLILACRYCWFSVGMAA